MLPDRASLGSVEPTFTIGRLARAADVPVSTLRYYERRGLLSPELRAPSSYRLYTSEQLRRLRFIKAAQASGFTLEDIRSLLELRERAGSACADVRELIARRLGEVRSRLDGLRHVEEVLAESLEDCGDSGSARRCPAIEGLESAASRGDGERGA